MKYVLAWMLVSIPFTTAAQLYKTPSRSHLFFADIRTTGAKVWAMGTFYDAAGTGSAVEHVDTLQVLPDSSYRGMYTHIFREDGKLYLVSTLHKPRKQILETVSMQEVNSALNNAYLLRQYTDMSRRLNTSFPLHYFTFREAFNIWDSLPARIKEMDHKRFRQQTDRNLRGIEDSVVQIQQDYVRRMDYMLAHVQEMDFATMRDSLAGLPVSVRARSGYYAVVVKAVAFAHPAYYLQLAEADPAHHRELYLAIVDDKQVADRVLRVQGHEVVKRQFLKERRAAQWTRGAMLVVFAGTVITLTYMMTKIL